MKSTGFALMLLGLFVLVYGGAGFDRRQTVVRVGSFEATATQRSAFPIVPLVGGIVLLAGIVLFVVPKHRLLGSR